MGNEKDSAKEDSDVVLSNPMDEEEEDALFSMIQLDSFDSSMSVDDTVLGKPLESANNKPIPSLSNGGVKDSSETNSTTASKVTINSNVALPSNEILEYQGKISILQKNSAAVFKYSFLFFFCFFFSLNNLFLVCRKNQPIASTSFST